MAQVEKFGKYILLERLAAGGMAEVYLAKSTGASGVNKFLAIKRILPQFSENQEFINMFKEEAKIAVNLNHSNVVAIYDFGVEKEQFYLVMEYVEGKNLRQILNEHKKFNLEFTLEQAIYIIKEVAAGLDHAHRCLDGSTGKPLNITHRDMSPQNIMVSYEGEIKVIDFGIAKAETQTEATRVGTLKGKFGYMSPEQAEGYPIDSRTDIFSLGIVMWELLTNERLFSGNSEAAILRKIRECQIPSASKYNPNVTPELEVILSKALAKDKSLRYQTCSQLHKDLNKYLNTNFPEFSSHDFSIFIKKTFSDTLSEQKRKLVEFAKIKIDDPKLDNGNDKQKAFQPSAVSVAVSSAKNNPVSEGQNDDQPHAPANLNLAESPKIDAGGILKQNQNGLTGSRTLTRQTVHGNSTKQTGTYPNNTSFNTGVFQTKIAKKEANSDFLGTMIKGLIAVCFALAGWIGYNEYIAKYKLSKAILGNTQLSSETNPIQQSLPKQSTVKTPTVNSSVSVMIDSIPSGAKIFIEDAELANYTPSTIELSTEKEVKVKLIKEGFIPYEAVWTPIKGGTTLKATLQPYPRIAYISIDLINGGNSPIIEVNGIRLSESPPIRKYTIPAGVPIRISARNPFTGAVAEKDVNVGANLKESVELVLGFPKK